MRKTGAHFFASCSSHDARLNQLDGLRGVAAFSVVIYHFVCAFVPSATDPDATTLTRPGEVVLRFLFSGSFAVAIFFVLSGFVIANSAAGRRQPLLVSALLRYLRLALPAAASVLLAWLLLRALPDAVRRLDAISPSWWFKWTYQDPIPPLLTALRDGLLDNFLTGGSQFNNVLWTMRIELIGSLLLYAIFAVSRGRVRIAVLVATGVLFIALQRHHYCAFILGALLREGWAAGKLPNLPAGRLFWAGLVLGSGASLIALLGGGPFQKAETMIEGLAATAVVFDLLACNRLKSLFGSAVPLFLGRISFGLYLVHVPILYTLVATGVVGFAALGPMALSLWFVAFVGISLFAGLVFTWFVDEPVLGFNKRLRRRMETWHQLLRTRFA
ncbi:Peptidoglycan/LPS O-acetylase OafA/YrhL, contains acyltransferase and SGNH-hydrolase domains [Bosea sp. OK403]|uniref:acyltransferase family protein n=1 Tax=Bosea sp. OK403 TaxID=1855286 RepID=UPI0008E8D52A|nr:acyltransferase [Bosea sp. OK403]SFJ61423.1 Peptidoglycan/LPS O-acetylase OafA/YrhL, contains acyltransferase and SGNH-hydrolase domains [Bosea sp. OK403]